MTQYQPDLQALSAAPTRIVVGGGIETIGQLTGRAAAGLAEALGEPEAFAGMLREVLDGDGKPSAT